MVKTIYCVNNIKFTTTLHQNYIVFPQGYNQSKTSQNKPFIKAQQFLIHIVPINFSLPYFLKNVLAFGSFEP